MAQARDIFGAGTRAQGTGGDGSANKRGSFGTVNVLEGLRIDAFAFGLHVSDLTTDHSIDCASGGGNFAEDRDAPLGRGESSADGLEG